MLRKIDCVMIRVEDLNRAVDFYTTIFGLHRIWYDDRAVGLGFPDTDAEIVLHCDQDIPSRIEVHYLVDDVQQAVALLRSHGCEITVEPFDIPIGKCAVILDPFGTPLNILDMSRGPRG